MLKSYTTHHQTQLFNGNQIEAPLSLLQSSQIQIKKLNSEVVLTCEPSADFSEKLVMIMNDVVLFAGSGRQEDRPIICEQ